MTVSIHFRSFYNTSELATPGSTSARLIFGTTLWFLHLWIDLKIRFQNNGIALIASIY